MCILCSEAFGLNMHDEQLKRTYALSGSATFEDVFAAGLKALNLEVGVAVRNLAICIHCFCR